MLPYTGDTPAGNKAMQPGSTRPDKPKPIRPEGKLLHGIAQHTCLNRARTGGGNDNNNKNNN